MTYTIFSSLNNLKKRREDNYVSNWWTKEAYLTFRDSLLKLNFYGGGFLAPPTSHMTSRAAMLASLYLELIDQMKSGKMKAPLLQKMIPMCPDQYKRFYGTSRIPMLKEDRLKTWKNSNHIAVNYRSKWFTVKILRNDCPLNSGEKLHRVTGRSKISKF